MSVEVDERSVKAAVAGDADALSELLRRCEEPLRDRFAGRIARRYLAALDAEDVLQVTFMEAFIHIKKFTWRGPRSLYAWLCQIGENNLRDAIGELDAEKRVPRGRQVVSRPAEDRYTTFLGTLPASGTTPTQQARRNEAKEAVESALAVLPPDYAQAIRLYDIEGLHIEEVCRAFNPPRKRGAVHMLRMRGTDCLRELLGQPERYLTTQA